MKVVVNLLFYLLFANLTYSQTILLCNKESYVNVSNDTVKQELRAFCSMAGKTGGQEEFTCKKLREIQLYKISDTIAYFVKSNFFTSELLTISLYSKGINPNLKLSKIIVLFYKQYVNVPDTALRDILNTVFCQQVTKKRKPILCNCKVFQSIDKKRVYIHMMNSIENDKYEVTWIIKDRKYFGRIIDEL